MLDSSISGPGNQVARTGREEDRAPSLSMGHISPLGEIKVWVGGGLLQACKPELSIKPPRGGGLRGKATFSKKSRLRLMRKLSMVKTKFVPKFLTLTYPSEFPKDPEKWKRDKDAFWKRALRKFPEIGWIWKIEPQKRAAPHFHMLVWGVDLEEFMSFAPLAWYQVVGSNDPKHLLWHEGKLGNGNQHCVQALKSFKGAKAYASKYLAKVVGEDAEMWDDGIGRWWGCKVKKTYLGPNWCAWKQVTSRSPNSCA